MQKKKSVQVSFVVSLPHQLGQPEGLLVDEHDISCGAGVACRFNIYQRE